MRRSRLFLCFVGRRAQPDAMRFRHCTFWVRHRTAVLTAVFFSWLSCGQSAAVSDDQAAWAAFLQKSGSPSVEHYGAADPLQELEVHPATEARTPRPAKPVLMLVHGGGWGGGTRDALAPHARYFAALGWTSVNISYRLTSQPGVTL